jgi:hypothetical protein
MVHTLLTDEMTRALTEDKLRSAHARQRLSSGRPNWLVRVRYVARAATRSDR